tara:strand:- start:1431 stop:2906 length:1476 start_codon:yes stop_codon:yes gene_type:complete
MKSFHSFITERKAKNFGTKGGEGGTQSTSNTPYNRRESRANMQDPNRSQRGGRPNPVRGRRTPVNIPSKSGDLITNFAADANVPPEEQFQRLLDKAAKDASGERVGQQATHPVDAEAGRQSGRERTGGRVKGDRPVGAQKPRTRFVPGQRYTIPTPGKPATRIPGGTGTYSGSLAKGTLKFSGDAKYRQELEKLGIKLGDKVKRTSTSTTTAAPTRVTSGDIDLGKVQSKSIKTSVPKVNVTTSQNIDLGKVATPAPKPSPTAISVTNRASVNLPSTYRPKLRSGPQVKVSVPASVPKAAPVTRVAPQPAVAKSTTSNVKVKPQAPSNVRIKAQPKSVAGAADDVMKQMGSHMRKGARIASRTAGAAGALYDIGSEFATLKKMGASNVKAATGSVVRAAGGALGGAIGAGLGAPAGPVGSIPGAIAGYTVGADTASRLFDRIAGAPDEKTTPEKIKKNTARLANDAKKTFGQFTSGLGKAYTGFVRPEYRR